MAARKRFTAEEHRVKAYEGVVSLSDWPSEGDENYADRVLRARYYRQVKSMAVDHLTSIANGEFESLDAADDALTQTIDGSNLVIMTAHARMVAYVSDRAMDAEEECDDCGQKRTPEAVAYFCLFLEVTEEIARQADEILECSVSDWFAGKEEE